jgi:hypothetical protein
MYGSADHDHHDLSRAIDDVRYDAQRQVDDLRDEMHQMRRELADYIRTEVEGLHEARNMGSV